jgi:hypothetical protein
LWIWPGLPAAPTQFALTANDGAITITGYSGSGGAVTIPSTTNGLPVTSIGVSAFHDCTNLTGVTILDGITNIGDDAFDYCTSLTSVTLPNSVSSMGNYVFYFCTSLTNVAMGNSVTGIDEQRTPSRAARPISATRSGRIMRRDSTGWPCREAQASSQGGSTTVFRKSPASVEQSPDSAKPSPE